MAFKKYVYSTLPDAQEYTLYRPSGENRELSIPVASVVIAGGAGLANDQVWTPSGVRTEITDEQEAILRQVPMFTLHEENGFVRIEESKEDADNVANDMNPNAAAKPARPDQFAEDEGDENDPRAAAKGTTLPGGKPAKRR